MLVLVNSVNWPEFYYIYVRLHQSVYLCDFDFYLTELKNDPLKMALLDGETIHSGQFMASNVHEFKPEDDEEIDVISDSGLEPPDPEVTPDTKDDKPVTFYKFGPQTTRSIAIDVSLTKLNKCIQIAYEKGYGFIYFGKFCNVLFLSVFPEN